MNKKLLLIAIGVFGFCSNANSDATNSIVTRITVLDDVAFIKVTPVPATRPTCSDNGAWHYAFNVTNDTGKSTFSLALAAYAAKTKVTVKSKNICTHYPNMEDVQYLILEET